MRIYHLAYRDVWAEAQATGVYRGREEDRADGFLHFSNAAQIVVSAAKHKPGAPDLILLAVEEKSLGEALVWEESRGGKLFPHLYGDLPVAHVVSADPLPVGSDGLHVFPEMS